MWLTGLFAYQALDDAFVLDLEGMRWVPVHTPLGSAAGHAAVVCPVSQSLVVFGGGDNEGQHFKAVHRLPLADILAQLPA
jgi:hypothetical protein